LLQDGKPVEFASRALRQFERNWAQIEKEALSMLYGLECFDQYTYGRKVIDGLQARVFLGCILNFKKSSVRKIIKRIHVHDTGSLLTIIVVIVAHE
jgi:hypothetical protein